MPAAGMMCAGPAGRCCRTWAGRVWYVWNDFCMIYGHILSDWWCGCVCVCLLQGDLCRAYGQVLSDLGRPRVCVRKD